MRILILNADYPRFLTDLYLSEPGLYEAGFSRQMAARNRSLFGVADFYSRNFKAHGHEAAEIHLNNPWLQHAWARENGLDFEPPPPPAREDPAVPTKPAGSGLPALVKPVARRVLGPLVRTLRGAAAGQMSPLSKIFYAQVEAFRPDVILNQEMAYLRSPALKRIKQPGRLIVGQIASALPEEENYGVYDCVISSLPNLVKFFRGQGVRAELNRLAFEPSILETLGPQPKRDIPVSFVGSLSPEHGRRIAFLEYLAERTPLQIWGNGAERLPASSPIHACYRGEAWGRGMYDILRRSRITLNYHIDLAEDWANNMRLYEATGMGTLLLTDAKRNLSEIFVPDEQIVAYESPEHCAAQIKRLLGDESRLDRIAAAGQVQAIEVQNYFGRTAEISTLCDRLRN